MSTFHYYISVTYPQKYIFNASYHCRITVVVSDNFPARVSHDLRQSRRLVNWNRSKRCGHLKVKLRTMPAYLPFYLLPLDL